MRGGEKVLDALAQLYPQAELFTLLADQQCLTLALRKLKLHTSILESLPGSHRTYRKMLPLMPWAIERLDLRGFDLVISSSHCVAKGVRVPQGVPHICYCHSPMRYAWHLRDLYLSKVNPLLRPVAAKLLDRLKKWDRQTACRVKQFVANGKTVQRRIHEAYGRDSVIIHPPVDTKFFVPDPDHVREDYYLVVSALAPNKRVELAVEACTQLNRQLVVIGSGPEEKRLRQIGGPKSRFLGWCSDDQVREHYRRCRALLFPGEEDFGMVPIEANACGTPVIALGVDGATETIIPPGQSAEPTGLWFSEATVESLIQAIKRFELEPGLIKPEACRTQAERFRGELFFQGMRKLIDEHISR